jgi:hypothetical protein
VELAQLAHRHSRLYARWQAQQLRRLLGEQRIRLVGSAARAVAAWRQRDNWWPEVSPGPFRIPVLASKNLSCAKTFLPFSPSAKFRIGQVVCRTANGDIMSFMSWLLLVLKYDTFKIECENKQSGVTNGYDGCAWSCGTQLICCCIPYTLAPVNWINFCIYFLIASPCSKIKGKDGVIVCSVVEGGEGG